MATSLMDYLDKGAVVAKLDAGSSEEVIRALAAKLEALGYVKPSYVEAVLKREATMPTGLPMGDAKRNVAVPHTDPEHVLKPGIALATLTTPVNFANMEDPDEAVPVSTIVMLALNDKDAQVEMLSTIIATIQDEAIIEAFAAAQTTEDVIAALS
ncbi:PTS sugar transporter subunit IIA [Limoniibacter endophyticus]|uniref:PTS sugar transporter subunit IIA n=1 Tax=Limoniibacter endophyticus TaxID=1565040 RepID=A0A8J3GGA2_9HYPH|nr:PTS sugar transporter subunit IIA [Limoniibacter endophyticus]GHC64297.1 PTS sugar transporter subunit IIA [Limoniibacter endophyticus]